MASLLHSFFSIFFVCIIAVLTVWYKTHCAMRVRGEVVEVANRLLEPKGLHVFSYSTLQNLWAGYGKICELLAIAIHGGKDDTETISLIMKYAAPPTGPATAQDEGHLRKVISYQVEQYFYTHLAPQMSGLEIEISECLASVNEQLDSSTKIVMVLTDLRKDFPVPGEKRGKLTEMQVNSALKWLASFHGFWWNRHDGLRGQSLRLPPLEEATSRGLVTNEGVWLNGGYTYLGTRQKEYASLKADLSSEWSSKLCRPNSQSSKSVAEMVADVLSPSSSSASNHGMSDYGTLIHGDVKSENLFSTASGDAVAFYDFQYVGLGLGVSDLAKLFTVSVPLNMLTDQKLGLGDNEEAKMGDGERTLLEFYQKAIETMSGKQYPWKDFEMHWNTALVDWLRFQASWGFWGNTEWLEGRVRHILKDQAWLGWLLEQSNK